METDSICLMYKDIIGVQAPWMVTEVRQDKFSRVITVRIEHDPKTVIACPVCAQRTKLYDHRVRVLRYLDTCQYETFLEVHIPRVKCEKDGVQQIQIPYAEKHSRFTSRFETSMIDWLKTNSIKVVADSFKLSWDEADGIKQRAVKRGLSRRQQQRVYNMGIDETSYQKRHEYVTIILDKDRDRVIDVLDDRKAESLENWLNKQKSSDLSQLNSITMDMWDPYIKAVTAAIPGGREKIAFDRFHVSKHFNAALDKVRRREHSVFMNQAGESPLSSTPVSMAYKLKSN